MKLLKGKVVVITGASSGIGRALALVFAGYDAIVVMAARRKDELEKIISTSGIPESNFLAVQMDVRKMEDCKKLIDTTIEHFGKIDILVNNAGISMRALFDDVDLTVLHELMDVNFWGTVYCTKFALPYIQKTKGSIVGVSSIAGTKGLPGRTGYSASKFAMHGLLETVRIENIKKGVHVLIACPGYTSSNIRNTALGKDGKPQMESPLDENKLMSAEKVANEILKAVVKRKRTLILTTQGNLTVLLNRFFPAWMDGVVYKVIANEKESPFK